MLSDISLELGPQRTFKSPAEMRAHYKLIRQRCFNPIHIPQFLGYKEPEPEPDEEPKAVVADTIEEPQIAKLERVLAATIEAFGEKSERAQAARDDIATFIKRQSQGLLCEHRILRLIRIASAVCGISREDMISAFRSPRFARPRQVVMFIAYHDFKMSLPEIGRKLGHRDHTTVLSGVRKIQSILNGEHDGLQAVDRALVTDQINECRRRLEL